MSEANPDAEFLDHSSISYFIPSRTNFKVEQTLKQAAESHRSLLDAINQRKSLFFDETVDVYLVLRTPSVDEPTLRSYLSRLILSLEAQIVNSQPSDRESPPVNEVIFTGSPDDIEDPIIVLDGADDSDGEGSGSQGQYILVIWKLSIFLERPRLRLQNPSAIFTVTAELKPADAISGSKDGYLPSGMACGMNLLESFGNDPALSGVRPRLSALRVSRVAPLTNERDQIRSIKAQKNLTLRVYPAVHTRVRFARPNTAPPSPAILALLEVDFTPYFDCEIVLDKITLAVADGMVEDLNSSEGMKLPLSCVAHDHVTFLYRLTPTDLDSPSKQLVRDLEITIDATALVRPAKCHPRLTMSWHTSLDFTLPVNPGFGPAAQPIQRSHKPSQLSISGGGDISSLKSPSLTRPDAIPALEAAARSEAAAAATPPEIGIAVTLAGPGSPVYVGDVFSWNVFVVNHASPNVAPGTATGTQRKLALIAIPSRRRNDVRTARPPSFSGSTSGKGKLELLADAVVDENVVHAIQRGAVVEPPDVVCLSADTRIGPLAPGACHVAELKFLALKEGVLGIEALRVVDLGSNEHVDVFDLPMIVVEKRED